MDKAELGQLLTQLKAQSNGADATSMMIALVRYASPTEMTADAVALACNISRRTVFRKETFSFKPCQLDTATQCQSDTTHSANECHLDTMWHAKECQSDTVGKEKESFPPHPLIKNKETESSLRSDISGAGAPATDGADGDGIKEGFNTFVRIYPKPIPERYLRDVEQTYREVVASGMSPESIETVLWACKNSEKWTEGNGKYIPFAINFLKKLLSSGGAGEPPIASHRDTDRITVNIGGRGATTTFPKDSPEAMFLNAYCNPMKDLRAFNVAFRQAADEVGADVVAYAAEIACEWAREHDGNTRYMPSPEVWLEGHKYRDYLREARNKKRMRDLKTSPNANDFYQLPGKV